MRRAQSCLPAIGWLHLRAERNVGRIPVRVLALRSGTRAGRIIPGETRRGGGGDSGAAGSLTAGKGSASRGRGPRPWFTSARASRGQSNSPEPGPCGGAIPPRPSTCTSIKGAVRSCPPARAPHFHRRSGGAYGPTRGTKRVSCGSVTTCVTHNLTDCHESATDALYRERTPERRSRDTTRAGALTATFCGPGNPCPHRRVERPSGRPRSAPACSWQSTWQVNADATHISTLCFILLREGPERAVGRMLNR
jgi:hypothetical protein